MATCNLEYELTTNMDMVQIQINFDLGISFAWKNLYFTFIMLIFTTFITKLISRIYDRIRYNNGLYFLPRIELCTGYVAICNHVCLISKVPFRVNFQIHHFICLFCFPLKSKKIHCGLKYWKPTFGQATNKFNNLYFI